MQKYLLIITENGVGCDYTIDCGKTYKIFEAEDDTKAREWLDEFMNDSCQPREDEYGWTDIQVLPFKEEDVIYSIDDYHKTLNHNEAEEVAREIAEKEEAERAELERLKAKYE